MKRKIMGNDNGTHEQKQDELWLHINKFELSLPADHESLYQKLQAQFIPNSSPQQKQLILAIAQKWKSLSFENLIQDESLFLPEHHQLYKNIEFLSARVYGFVQRLTKDIMMKKSIDDQQLMLAAEFISQEKLTYSYDRYFWEKKTKNLPHSILQNRKKEKPLDTKTSQKINEMLASCKLLEKLYKFLVSIEVIAIDPLQSISNKFILNLQRIVQKEQRSLYLDSLQLNVLEELRACSTEKNQREHQEFIWKKQYPNYYFYNSKDKNSICSLHSRYKNYEFLEGSHDYIQLMFPNHYGSSFNMSAAPLNYVESKLFWRSLPIGLKMLQSIVVFFDFLGIKLRISPLELNLVNKKRLMEALIFHTHNHLRIMRILACLSVVGFRSIALKLIEFLDRITSTQPSFTKVRGAFQKKWQIYGEKQFQLSTQMCFLQDKDYPPEHPIFGMIKAQLEQAKQQAKVGQ